ncbi:aldo/keto reductase [Biformimicrobium ophioploci]|uniref:Aldo/keto reductase family oxidoreductase n=1 Tax=Biformimicrobium ophioploci TaxID=3036711 RepID=A0ABQ6M119_9GAMM|nr:aldo/keto reductase [Microbulbifer sp. NKW57]GMG88046.1 aldo/keto reductase family oxidoreductase [Microbulbifer sp. NKW57]
MEKISLPGSHTDLSRLVMGLWRLTDWNMEPHARLRFTEEVLELGITSFDLADIYGDYQCEATFGHVLKQAPALREKIQLVSKCDIKLVGSGRPHRLNHYDTSAAHIEYSVENSLRALNTDYLDLLLLHRPDPLMNADETAEILDRLVASGKVRAIGVSNFLPHQADLLASRLESPLAANQIEASVLHTQPLFDGQLDHCQQHQIVPMGWSPFGGGRLFTGVGEQEQRVRDCLDSIAREYDASPSQIALAWLLRHPAKILPIVGSGQISRVREAVGALNFELEREHWFEILKASRGRDVD